VNNDIPISIDTIEEALELLRLPDAELWGMADLARRRHSGSTLDICAIVNAKSGACPEDCAFCAQSARNRTGAPVYPLLTVDAVREAAASSLSNGARRFCVVTSGRAPRGSEVRELALLVGAVKDTGLSPCATLGMIAKEDLQLLRESGLNRYHHNLETSEAFFPSICATHTFRDKLDTLHRARELGLSLCSGGLFGLGESWRDRVEMAFVLRELAVDSVPVNFLMPVPGTPTSNMPRGAGRP